MLYDKRETNNTVNIHNKFFLNSNIIYPKSKIKIPNSPNFLKVLVFDLDETIGSFHEAAILWKIIESELQADFNTLMDLYPEFLRYGILQIIEFILNKKKIGKCDKLYLYTNNINSPVFPNLISEYLKYILKIEHDIFDKLIYAFKVNNKIIEHNRTTHKKTYNDFINCTVLPENIKICFIDDKYYSKMENEKIYYIQPSPYYHNLTNKEIISRFSNSVFNSHENMNKVNSILNHPQIDYNYEDHMIQDKNKENKENKKIYKKIMYYVKEFFYLTNRNEKTKKIRISLGKFTRKKR
jgi:cellobiose-specific phosphotransferase system component IIB